MDAIEQQSIAASSSGLSAAASARTAAAGGIGQSAGAISNAQDQLPPIHSFPPFFTLQPNPTTLITQLNLWSELVLGYTQRKRIWSIDADGEWERTGELFFNKAIDSECCLQRAGVISERRQRLACSNLSPALRRKIKSKLDPDLARTHGEAG